MLLLETVDALAPYTWLLVFAGVIAFALAIGIGANDVSNTFGSAVGAGTLSLRQAVVIACVFELLGSVLLGGKVSALIKEKLIDHDAFKDRPDVLLLVLVAALISSAAWLLLATFLRLPVSTTHTVVGSVLGAGVVAHGLSAIRWTAIGWIVAAWFLSPVLTCLLATVAFRILRQAVLRQDPRLSLQRANRFIPALAFVIAIANVACISVNAAVRPAVAVPVALVVGVAAACTPSLFTRVIRVLSRPTPAKLDIELEQQTAAPGRLVRSVSFYEHVAALHERAEHFPAGTERALSTVQCLTAMFNAFTHGSNDVSNSVGLFSAVVTLFQKGTTRDHGGIPPWILSVGGVGISLGLVLFGHRLMSTMGKRLSKITPSRGIVIDVTSAFIVMLASQFGITVSSTQCVVGSTIGVGAAEGVRQGVNWRLVLRTVFGWIGTLVVSSLTSAAIFSFAAFTPSAVSPTHG
ncbi:Phosphate transporter [Plasmodiophora brassicae]